MTQQEKTRRIREALAALGYYVHTEAGAPIMIEIIESGKPDDAIVIHADEFDTWQTSQPDTVVVTRFVYPDETSLN